MAQLNIKTRHIPWIVILVVLVLDQTFKIIVKTSMTLGEQIPVLGDWFILLFLKNEGMAFGLEIPGEHGKLMLSLFRIIAVIFIGWYIHSIIKKGANPGLIICISLIMAGALGNIIDSAFYGLLFSASTFTTVAEFLPEGGGYAGFLHGHVVDMLYFPLIRGYYPEWFPFWGGQEFIFFRYIFNLSDTAITIGVFILLIFQKRFFAFEKEKLPA